MHALLAVAVHTIASLLASPNSLPHGVALPDQPEKQPAPAPTPPADPSTEDILKDIERQRGKTPPPAPAPTPTPASNPAPTPTTPAATPATPVRVQTSAGRLLREGTFLVDRRGRIIRAPGGEWLFTFDADAKGQSDPTMILMPCQKLEAMEKLAERYGESLTFNVTGQVFVYKNRNHLLPATFRVNRPGEHMDIKTNQ